jgi:hypothetical protein
MQPVLEKVDAWGKNQGDLVKCYGTDPELMVLDSRSRREPLHYPFNGLQQCSKEHLRRARSEDWQKWICKISSSRPLAILKDGSKSCREPFLQPNQNMPPLEPCDGHAHGRVFNLTHTLAKLP